MRQYGDYQMSDHPVHSFSWMRRDLVETYGWKPESIMMMDNQDLINEYYKITGGM